MVKNALISSPTGKIWPYICSDSSKSLNDLNEHSPGNQDLRWMVNNIVKEVIRESTVAVFSECSPTENIYLGDHWSQKKQENMNGYVETNCFVGSLCKVRFVSFSCDKKMIRKFCSVLNYSKLENLPCVHQLLFSNWSLNWLHSIPTIIMEKTRLNPDWEGRFN